MGKFNTPENTDLLKIIQDLQDRLERLERAVASQSRLIPAGGTTGQSLKKVSNTDYDVHWA